MSSILIVDDEASICWAFRESLADEGHHVEVASSAEEGLRIVAAAPPDAVVLDIRLPGMDGLTAMKAFHDRIGSAPIIVITAFGNLETAVRAMEGGAFDYLVKPFDLDQATTVVKRALERRNARDIIADTQEAAGPETLIGTSPAMQDLFKSIALVAPADVPVLITGETGTGKELAARAIHRHSGRRHGPFVPICLAALSPSLVEGEIFGHLKGSFTGATQDRKGLLELASGGTVLLDEVGDIPTNLQVKLLRAIEHREVTPVGDARPRFTDIRVIAATNRPLSELMASGQFREDLFFRLSVFQIHLPPLRAARGYRRSGRALPETIPFAGRRRYPPVNRGARRTPLASLDGQRPRVEERRRARGDRCPRPPDTRSISPRPRQTRWRRERRASKASRRRLPAGSSRKFA